MQVSQRASMSAFLAGLMVAPITAALIPPFFLDCVVAIGYRPLTPVKRPDGTVEVVRGPFTPVASGFLYGHFVTKGDRGNEYSIYLVTNQHVLEDVERIERQQIEQASTSGTLKEEPRVFLRFNPKGNAPARDDFWVPLHHTDPLQRWVQDKHLDVAVVGIAWEVLEKAGIQYSYFRSDHHVATRAKANELGLTEGDVIYVLGFPMGLVGGERNFVIARQGAIARIRDTLAGSTARFLIDALIFPGNSGGPVVTRPEANAIEGTKRQHNAYLIGVVQGYLPYQDVAISQQTGRPRVTFEENSGLGDVIPMDAVTKLVEQREKLLRK